MPLNKVELKASYILLAGQHLLDQEPYNLVIPELTRLYSLNPVLLSKILFHLSHNTEYARLPFYDPNKPDPKAVEFYREAYRELKSKNLTDKPVHYIVGLASVGRKLARFPNSLDYLDLHQEPPYDENGSWTPHIVTYSRSRKDQNKKPNILIYTPIYAALSYAFWEYTRQVRRRELPSVSQTSSVLSEAQVIGMIGTGKDSPIYQMQTWQINAVVPSQRRIID